MVPLETLIPLLGLVCAVLSTDEPQCICVEDVPGSSGIVTATSIRSLSDDTGRLYISEAAGNIWILQDGQRVPEPLLAISQLNFSQVELLSFNFHPQYLHNGRAFLFYAYVEQGVKDIENIVLVEIKRDMDDENKLDLNRMTELINIPIKFEFNSHKGGDVSFLQTIFLFSNLRNRSSR